jgi:hypothetical protein
LYLSQFGSLGRWEVEAHVELSVKVIIKVGIFMIEVEETKTSPKHIMPQNAHIYMAQIQALNGSSRINVTRRACNMFKVIGGRMGHLQDPCKFLSPCSDQSMQLWSSPDSGGGQP